MRTFLICLLAVSACASELSKKSTGIKQQKRGILSEEYSTPNLHSGQQLIGVAGAYRQVGYQHDGHGLGSGISGYSSGLGYTAGSLPAVSQTYSTGIYDTYTGQLPHHQQGSLLSGGVQQQVGQGVYGYSGSVSTLPIQSRVISRVVNVPVSVPHPVPVTRTVQVPVPHPVPVEVRRPVHVPVPRPVPVVVTRTYPVTVNRPVPVPVPQPIVIRQPISVPVSIPHPVPVQISHQEPVQISSGYETSVGQNIFSTGGSYGQGNIEGHGASLYTSGTSLEGVGHNIGSQQYNFGGPGINVQASGVESTHHSPSYQHQIQPIQEISTGSTSSDHSSGYTYDVPAKKFTF